MIRASFGLLLALGLAAPALSAPATVTVDSIVGRIPREQLGELLVLAAEEHGSPAIAARARGLLEASPGPAAPGSSLMLARACLASRPQDFGCARRLLEQARAAGAAAREVDQRLGFIASALGDDAGARQLLERSMPGGPDDALAALLLARLAMARGDAAAAERLLRNALAASPRHAALPGHAQLSAQLGRVLAEVHPESPAAALAALDDALAADPRELGARLLRARLLARSQPSSAQAATDLVVHGALIRAAELAKRPARDEEARRERLAILRRLVSLEPGVAQWHLEEAQALAEAGLRDEALASLRSAAKAARAPEHLAAAATLAASLGDATNGLELARRAMGMDAAPGSPSRAASAARQAAGAGLLILGRPAEALAELEAALVTRAHRADLRTLLADAYLATGQRSRAIDELSAALQLDPTDARAASSLGGLLREDGKLAEAAVLLDEALRLNPREASAHANRGLLLHDQRRDVEALEELRAAVELAPADRLMRWNLGALLVMQGRMREALPHLEAAVAQADAGAVAPAGPGKGAAAPPEAEEWLRRARAAVAAGSP